MNASWNIFYMREFRCQPETHDSRRLRRVNGDGVDMTSDTCLDGLDP
jgi:hypothetical protein